VASQVVFEMDMETMKGVQKLAQVGGQLDEVTRKLKGMTGESKKASTEQVSGWQASAKAIATYAAGFFGVQAGIRLIKDEMRDYIRLQKEALEAGRTWSEARATALEMAPGRGPEISGIIAGASRKAGVPETEMWRAAPALISAGAGLTNEQMISALSLGAEYMKVQGGGGAQIAERAPYYLDIMRQTGVTDARAAAGALASLTRAARVQSAGAVAQNLVPALTGYRMYGDQWTEGAEMMAGLTFLLGDVEGAETKTLYTGIRAGLIKPIVPSRLSGAMDPITGKATAGAIGGGSTMERLRALQAMWPDLTPREREAILPKIARGKQGQGVIRALLGGEEDIWRTFTQAQGEIISPTSADAGAYVSSYFADVYAAREAGIGARRVAGTALREESMRARGGENVFYSEQLTSGLEAAGVGRLGRYGAQAEYWARTIFGQEPGAAALDVITPEWGGLARRGEGKAAGALKELADHLRQCVTILDRMPADETALPAGNVHTE